MSHPAPSNSTARRWAAALTGLAVAAFSVLATVPPAVATTAPESEGPAKLMLVLDSSGSMAWDAGDGQPRIRAARKALHAVVDHLPEGQEVGMRVYGAGPFREGEPGACTDSDRVVDLGADNRGDLRRAIDAYTPRGETPTGFALQQAGKDLGTEGRRNIVLVSDGEPTCPPAPCEVARDLRKQGIGLRIDVVGFGVSGAARKSLKCVADAGGGVYYDADSAQELTDSLVTISERAARPYTPVGQPVDGTPEPAGAPVITAGDWVDVSKIPTNGHSYYRIERQYESSVVVAGTAWRGSPGGNNSSALTLQTPDGRSCDTNVAQAGAGELVGNAVTVGADSPEECLEGDLILGVEIQWISESPEGPLEIRVLEPGEVTDVDSLPEPAEPTWQAPPATQPRAKVTGGTSFADAEPLSPGSYRGEIVPGEILTFSVDADYGQQIHARLNYPPLPSGYEDVAALTQVEIFSPARARAYGSLSEAPESQRTHLQQDGVTLTTMTSSPISIHNLSGGTDEQGASLAGDYTVAVTMSPTKERTPSYEVPFQLDIGVTGQVAGVPEFGQVPVAGPTEPTEDPESAVPTEPTEDASEDGENTSASGGSTGGEDDSVSLVSYALGGLGVVALIVAAALLLLRRRTTT